MNNWQREELQFREVLWCYVKRIIDNEGIMIIKDFAYLGSVIDSNGDCRQEIKNETWKDSKGRISEDH